MEERLSSALICPVQVFADPLKWAALAMGLTAGMFALLAWLLSPEDRLIRRRLDNVWDRLHEKTLWQAATEALGRLYRSLDDLLSRNRAYTVVFFVAAALNCGAVVAALWLFTPGLQGGVGWRGLVDITFLSLALAAIDCASLWATVVLLGHVSRKAHPATIAFHFVLEAAIVVVGAVLTMAQFHFVGETHVYRDAPVWPGGMVWIILERIPELLDALPQRPRRYFLVLGTLCVTSMVPTFVYLALLLGVVVTWPRSVWRLVRRLVFLLATDDKPVILRLSLFIGGVAAFLTLILTAMD